MCRKLVCLFLCAALLSGLSLHAFAEDPTQERIPYAYYRTDSVVCVFYHRTVDDITPIIIKTDRLSRYGVSPVLASEGNTPVTYFVLMDATWYMSDRKAEMKELVEALFSGGYGNTRLILVPYDINNGLMSDQIIDTVNYFDVNVALSALKDKIESIKYDYQGESVPATEAVLTALRWIQDAYPSETGGIVNLVLCSYHLKSMNARGEQVQEIRNMLGSMPQVLFHTVQIGKRSGDIPSFGRGVEQITQETNSPSMAADAIRSFVGELERVLIPYAGQNETEDVLLFFQPIQREADGSKAMPSGITVRGVPYISVSGSAAPTFDLVEG